MFLLVRKTLLVLFAAWEVEADEEVNRFLKFSNALDAWDDDNALRSSLAITAGHGRLLRSLLATDAVKGML